jgi:hypothetical protein
VHNPRGLSETGGSSFGDHPGDGALAQAPSASPAVVAAVAAVADEAAAAAAQQLLPDQQWVTDARGGSERFIPLGGGDRHVAASLLVEALDYALASAASEQERVQLFVHHLLSSQGFASGTSSGPALAAAGGGGTPNLGPRGPMGAGTPPGAGAGAVATPPRAHRTSSLPAPPAAVVASAAAPLPGVESIDGGQGQGVLAQPDFSDRKTPPRSYTFLLVFGVLVVGLAVAGILDACGVLDNPTTTY